MFKPSNLFDLQQTMHEGLFEGVEFSWEVLNKIELYIAAKVKPVFQRKREGGAFIGERVLIGEGTVVEEGALIKGPAIIGRNCQIRHNA